MSDCPSEAEQNSRQTRLADQWKSELPEACAFVSDLRTDCPGLVIAAHGAAVFFAKALTGVNVLLTAWYPGY